MKTFKFVMRVSGSANGNVKANSKKEALEMLMSGQWNDIDIDVEDIIEVEHLIEESHKWMKLWIYHNGKYMEDYYECWRIERNN